MSWARVTQLAQRAWLTTFNAGATVTYTPGGAGAPAAFQLPRHFSRDQHLAVDLDSRLRVGMRGPELHVLEADLIAAGLTGTDDIDTELDRITVGAQLYGISDYQPDGRGVVVFELVEAAS